MSLICNGLKSQDLAKDLIFFKFTQLLVHFDFIIQSILTLIDRLQYKTILSTLSIQRFVYPKLMLRHCYWTKYPYLFRKHSLIARCFWRKRICPALKFLATRRRIKLQKFKTQMQKKRQATRVKRLNFILTAFLYQRRYI